MRNKKGFTLIELLVVIAIIGLLATLAVVALNNARQKSRDATRVSDIKQIQTSLELYFNDLGAYPAEATAVTLGGSSDDCFDEDGFVATCDSGGTTYMAIVPANPTPNGANYSYCSSATAGGACAASTASYTLTFTLEGATGGLAAGAHTATPTGIQ